MAVGIDNAVLGYGGAGGGGKSHLARVGAIYLNMLAAQSGIDRPRSIIATSNYPLLTDRQIGRLEAMRDWGKVTESRAHGLHFRFHDAALGVIALRNLDDPAKYRGTEAHAAFIDESTELPEQIKGYDTLASLLYPLRVPGGYSPIPLILTFNPDGVGFRWHYDLFITRRNIKQLDPERVLYLPATMDDNLMLDHEAYEANLRSYGEYIYMARRYGLWLSPSGAVFPNLTPTTQQFSYRKAFPHGIPRHWKRVIGIDYGVKAPYCAVWIAIDPKGNAWLYRMDYAAGLGSWDQAKRVVGLTGPEERIDAVLCDPNMWAKLPGHDGVPNVAVITDYQKAFSAHSDRFPQPMPANNQNKAHRISVLGRLLDHDNEFPNLYIEESCHEGWSELIGAVYDSRGDLSAKREEMDPRVPDHFIDATQYATGWLYDVPQEPTDTTPRPLSIAEWQALRWSELERQTHPGRLDYEPAPLL